MAVGRTRSGGLALAVLHPVFALTGVVQAIGGPLLVSLAPTFHLSDGDSGLLLAFFFAGTATGPFFCRRNYARALAFGYVVMAAGALAAATFPWPGLAVAFLILGIGNGIGMSGVSLYAGRRFTGSRASTITLLNFTWSAGALLSPLLAARVLQHHGYRAAYILVAAAAVVAALACAAFLRDNYEAPPSQHAGGQLAILRLIALFAFAAFLEVGIENTASTWLSTFVLRTAERGVVLAAASTSFYWTGFLVARGFASLLLLRISATHLFRVAVVAALASGVALASVTSPAAQQWVMLALGASLGPIYPLVIAGFFAHAEHTSQSRWVLATAGFGGSLLPWIAGVVSTQTGSLRLGLFVVPAALLVMLALLPALTRPKPEPGPQS